MLTGGRERRLTQTVTDNGVGAALIQVLTVPPRQLGGYAISMVRILHGKSRDQQLAVGRRCRPSSPRLLEQWNVINIHTASAAWSPRDKVVC
jgi:hypothetical protein